MITVTKTVISATPVMLVVGGVKDRRLYPAWFDMLHRGRIPTVVRMSQDEYLEDFLDAIWESGGLSQLGTAARKGKLDASPSSIRAVAKRNGNVDTIVVDEPIWRTVLEGNYPNPVPQAQLWVAYKYGELVRVSLEKLL